MGKEIKNYFLVLKFTFKSLAVLYFLTNSIKSEKYKELYLSISSKDNSIQLYNELVYNVSEENIEKKISLYAECFENFNDDHSLQKIIDYYLSNKNYTQLTVYLIKSININHFNFINKLHHYPELYQNVELIPFYIILFEKNIVIHNYTDLLEFTYYNTSYYNTSNYLKLLINLSILYDQYNIIVDALKKDLITLTDLQPEQILMINRNIDNNSLFSLFISPTKFTFFH